MAGKTRKRLRTPEQKAKEAERSKRRRLEEANKKKENEELIGNLGVQMERFEHERQSREMREEKLVKESEQIEVKWGEERLEMKRKEEEREKEREKLKEALRQKENNLRMEKNLWEVKFEEGLFDSLTRKKIACLLYNSSLAASRERLSLEKEEKEEEKEEKEKEEEEEEEEEEEGREKIFQRVAGCMETSPGDIQTWVSQPAGPSGVCSKEGGGGGGGGGGKMRGGGLVEVCEKSDICWVAPELEEIECEWGFLGEGMMGHRRLEGECLI